MDLEVKYKEIIDNLKNLNTHCDLRFREIISISDSKIEVSYYGHEVGGSYVHDYQVAPKYVEDIEYSTNRECKWLSSNSSGGGFGFDVYYFKVYPEKIKNINKYIPTGILLRVENCAAAFEYEFGHTWACLYSLTKELHLNNRLNNFNIKLEDNNIFIDDIKIAYLDRYINETYHSNSFGNTTTNRTVFTAIFDLFLTKNDFKELFFKKYKEIVDFYLKNTDLNCTMVYLRHDSDYGNELYICFGTGFIYRIKHNFIIIDEKDIVNIINDYNNYEKLRRYVNLPSGLKVEINNYNEVYFNSKYIRFHNSINEFQILNFILKDKGSQKLSEEDRDYLLRASKRLYDENQNFVILIERCKINWY